jgi:GT2 family glycosyltransferase
MKKISVVIPCRNESQYIEECLNAVYACDLPLDYQINVFVVDGMSDDGTRGIVELLKLKYQNLFLIDNKMQLTPYAFNLGIYAGKKVDFVQIVGARHILSENYLSSCLKKLDNDNSIWCVGGKIINEYINETGKVISKAMSTSFGMGLGNFRTLSKSGFTDTVTSPMYPYWVFQKIGYFDEELVRNQDDDFNYRVLHAGGKIFFNADISLKYYVRGDYKGLWMQFFQYGYWKVYVNKKHKAVTTIRQLVPPMFTFYVLTLILSSLISFDFFKIFSIPFILYLLISLYFSLKITKEDVEIGFIKVFKTFPILHLSYGLGYLKGILDFILLRKKPSDKQKRLSR